MFVQWNDEGWIAINNMSKSNKKEIFKKQFPAIEYNFFQRIWFIKSIFVNLSHPTMKTKHWTVLE